jgi:hypothetical protein
MYEYHKSIFEDRMINAPMYINGEHFIFFHMKTKSHRKFYIFRSEEGKNFSIVDFTFQ